MALSVVLGVNPSALLMPQTAEGVVELTGAGSVDAKAAWQWVDGLRPLHIPEDDDGTAQVDFQRIARPPGLRRYSISEAGYQAWYEDTAGVGFPYRGDDGKVFIRQPPGQPDIEVPEARHDENRGDG